MQAVAWEKSGTLPKTSGGPFAKYGDNLTYKMCIHKLNPIKADVMHFDILKLLLITKENFTVVTFNYIYCLYFTNKTRVVSPVANFQKSLHKLKSGTLITSCWMWDKAPNFGTLHAYSWYSSRQSFIITKQVWMSAEESNIGLFVFVLLTVKGIYDSAIMHL